MNPTKRLAGPCNSCGRSIDYPAHLVGTMAQCPYCRQATELRLAMPAQESSIPKRVWVFTVIAILIMVLGLAACFVALKWAEAHSGRQPGVSPVPVQQ